MRHPVSILTACLALTLTAPVAAQEEAPWRAKVGTLVDRWSNDVGSSRVERALTILDEHLRRRTGAKDGEALLAKARLLLARDTPATSDPHKAGELLSRNYRNATGTADSAANHLRSERRHVAMAVACVATNYHLQAELGKLELIPDSPDGKRLLAQKSEAIRKRRLELDKACGGEKATSLLAIETQRVATLRQIDRLGSFPRPIGQDDTDGRPVDLRAYEGKVLLVVFWSSKVGDRALLKEITALHREFGAKGFEVLGVNLDKSREEMDAVVTQEGMAWRQCFNGEGIVSRVAKAWGVRSMPSGVLIDRGGRVRYVDPWRRNLKLSIEELLSREQ